MKSRNMWTRKKDCKKLYISRTRKEGKKEGRKED
jgi:hypothetical protein